jgi:predicted transcriptional regulator
MLAMANMAYGPDYYIANAPRNIKAKAALKNIKATPTTTTLDLTTALDKSEPSAAKLIDELKKKGYIICKAQGNRVIVEFFKTTRLDGNLVREVKHDAIHFLHFITER